MNKETKQALRDLIPDVIKVGPYYVSITLRNREWSAVQGVDGLYHLEDRRIDLYLGGSPESVLEVLTHEILHACYHMMNVKEILEEEAIVNKLGIALVMVYQDNPKYLELIKFITTRKYT